MKLTQIEYFIAVCQCGSFTGAAEKCHISQPGISKAMQELEQECGVALFQRNRNNIQVTPQGRILLEHAQQFENHYQNLCQVVKNLAHSRTLLRIGVATMRGNTIFPKLHGAFLKEHPRTTIETIEETTNVLYELLDRQEIDFALCVTNHMPEEPYHHLLLRKSYLKLFVRKDHPLASRTSLSLKELKDVPLVMFSDHFDQTTYIKRMFAVSEVQPRIVHQTSQVFTILEYIRSEAAAGFLTEEIASQEPDLAAIPITEFHPAFITLVWNKNVRLHPAMEEFIRFVKQSRFIQPLEPPQKAEPSSSAKNKKAFSSCCSWRRLFLGNLFPNGLHDFFVSLAHFLGNQVEQGIEHIPIELSFSNTTHRSRIRNLPDPDRT